MKLELRHLAQYAPYGLIIGDIIDSPHVKRMYGLEFQNPENPTITTKAVHGGFFDLNYMKYDFLPVLFPIGYFLKGYVINGVAACPAVEMARELMGNQFEDYTLYNSYSIENFSSTVIWLKKGGRGIIAIELIMRNGTYLDIKYLINGEWQIFNTRRCFEILKSFFIDIDCLIHNNLALDASKFTVNPYEQKRD